MSSEIVNQAELEKLLDGEAPLDLSGKTMVGIDLDGRTIRGVVFSAHRDSRTLLKGFSARGASLIDCVLVGAEIDGSALQGARFLRCDLRYSSWTRSSFKDASLDGCDLYRATLGNDVDLSRSTIRRDVPRHTNIGGGRQANVEGPVEDPGGLGLSAG